MAKVEMKRIIKRYGNSNIITIGKEELLILGAKTGDKVNVTIELTEGDET